MSTNKNKEKDSKEANYKTGFSFELFILGVYMVFSVIEVFNLESNFVALFLMFLTFYYIYLMYRLGTKNLKPDKALTFSKRGFYIGFFLSLVHVLVILINFTMIASGELENNPMYYQLLPAICYITSTYKFGRLKKSY